MQHADKEIMERIRFRRKYLRLTYKELSAKTGIPETTLQRYEKGGIKNIPMSKLGILAKGLECDVNWLMGIKKDEPETVETSKYYLDDEAAALAEELKNRKDLRILLDASRKVSKEDLEFVIKLVEKLDKEDNN